MDVYEKLRQMLDTHPAGCPSSPEIIEILKLLPKTNCRECGTPTCMVFATQMVEGVTGVGDCPQLDAPNKKRLSNYLDDFRFSPK